MHVPVALVQFTLNKKTLLNVKEIHRGSHTVSSRAMVTQHKHYFVTTIVNVALTLQKHQLKREEQK